MLRELTSQKKTNDYRLKVLWVEDKQSEHLLHLSTISRHFRIWSARTPDEVASRLKHDVEAAFYQRSEPKIYDLPCLPVDGFLADFHLAAAAEDAQNREIVDGAGKKPIPEYDDEDVEDYQGDEDEDVPPETKASAHRAEAAGLTTAVLTALNFEGHPVVIVPYTGHQPQLSSQRLLIRLLAPPSIVISDGSELDRGKKSFEEKLQQLAIDYREAILEWAVNNVISIPSEERNRLKELAAGRAPGEGDDARVTWDDDDYIIVDTSYGRRGLHCAALWYTVDGQPPTLAEVNSWLDRIPTPGDVYAAAVELTEKYWFYSQTDLSKYRYILSRLLRKRMSTTPDMLAAEDDADIKLLCDYCEINFADAVSYPKTVLMESGKFVKHLLASDAPREVLRLAVLMLLTCEYAARWIASQETTAPLWKLAHIIDYKNEKLPDRPTEPFNESVVSNLSDIEIERLAEIMNRLGYTGISIKDGELLLERESVRDRDMAQRLDPLPEQLLTTEERFSGGRIYQRLNDIGVNLKELISGSEGWAPEPHELRDIQYYARDLGFPPTAWPGWLRKTF